LRKGRAAPLRYWRSRRTVLVDEDERREARSQKRREVSQKAQAADTLTHWAEAEAHERSTERAKQAYAIGGQGNATLVGDAHNKKVPGKSRMKAGSCDGGPGRRHVRRS